MTGSMSLSKITEKYAVLFSTKYRRGENVFLFYFARCY